MQQKMRAAADTSTLVSLKVSGMLPKALEVTELFCPETVESELREMSAYKDLQAKAAKDLLKLIAKGKISRHKVKSRRRAEGLLSREVDLGEAECFVLAGERNIGRLLIDDVNAAYALSGLAESGGIKLRISAAVIVELVKQGKITKAQARKALKRMIRIREWEGGVLEHLTKKYLGKV